MTVMNPNKPTQVLPTWVYLHEIVYDGPCSLHSPPPKVSDGSMLLFMEEIFLRGSFGRGGGSLGALVHQYLDGALFSGSSLRGPAGVVVIVEARNKYI